MSDSLPAELDTLRAAADQARALSGLSTATSDQGRISEARAQADLAVALAREAGDARLLVDVLCNAGAAYFYSGDSAAAAMVEEALRVARGAAYPAGETRALRQLAFADSYNGHSQAAQAHAAQALAIARAIGDRYLEAEALGVLGIVAEDLAARVRYCEQALAIFTVMGRQRELRRTENNLAISYASLGIYHKARQHA